MTLHAPPRLPATAAELHAAAATLMPDFPGLPVSRGLNATRAWLAEDAMTNAARDAVEGAICRCNLFVPAQDGRFSRASWVQR